MEIFEKDCWYKKTYDSKDVGFYDIFKVEDGLIDAVLAYTGDKSVKHSCFYRLYFDGRMKYYKEGRCWIDNNVTKLDSRYVKDLIKEHKERCLSETIKEVSVPYGYAIGQIPTKERLQDLLLQNKDWYATALDTAVVKPIKSKEPTMLEYYDAFCEKHTLKNRFGQDYTTITVTPSPLKEVNDIRPEHYGGKDNPFEVFKVLEAWGLDKCFHLGNVIKYVARAGKKDVNKEIEDLEKASVYLNKKIEQLKSLKK